MLSTMRFTRPTTGSAFLGGQSEASPHFYDIRTYDVSSVRWKMVTYEVSPYLCKSSLKRTNVYSERAVIEGGEVDWYGDRKGWEVSLGVLLVITKIVSI